MAFLGLMALAQIWFIPGYLFLYREKEIHRLDKILLAVPLSAVINYFVVYFLVVVGAYTQLAIIAILIIELIALLRLISKKTQQSVLAHSHGLDRVRVEIYINFTNIVFALFILIYACQFINQIGSVFAQSDVLMQYNPWAISWFDGRIPKHVFWYPQLLPILYSITYQFIGDTRIELAAKIAVSFYPLVTLAIIARMASILPTERVKILWSGIIFFLLVRILWGTANTVNGYLDFPLAFFCISITYVFALKGTEKLRKLSTDSIIYAIILSGVGMGAGLIKQSGVFLDIIIPFFWLALFRKHKDWQAHFKQSFSIGFAIALGLSTWYLYQYFRIYTGIEKSNLQMLSSIIPLPWYESILFGFKGVSHKLSWLWVPLFLMSIVHHYVRYIAIFLVAPFFLLWAAFVPYDYRNLAAVLPLLAICLSYGSAEILRILGGILQSRVDLKLTLKSIYAIVLLALIIGLSNSKINNELLKLSNKAKNQIGHLETNNLILAYFIFHPGPWLIASSDTVWTKNPSLSDRYSALSCRINYANEKTVSMESILSELDNPKIQYIYLNYWCDINVLDYFASQPEKYEALFKTKEAVFYRIK